MAVAAGVYGQTFIDILQGVASSPNLDTDTIEWIFQEDTTSTPVFDDTTPALADLTENIVTTAGTYTTGGEPLTNPGMSFDGSTHFKFDDTADVALTGTTIDADGLAGFSETATAPSTDPLLWMTDFGASYVSTNGNYNITWSTNGIFRFSLT